MDRIDIIFYLVLFNTVFNLLSLRIFFKMYGLAKGAYQKFSEILSPIIKIISGFSPSEKTEEN